MTEAPGGSTTEAEPATTGESGSEEDATVNRFGFVQIGFVTATLFGIAQLF